MAVDLALVSDLFGWRAVATLCADTRSSSWIHAAVTRCHNFVLGDSGGVQGPLDSYDQGDTYIQLTRNSDDKIEGAKLCG